MPLSSDQLQILATLAVLHPFGVNCGKVRIGGPNDGGYVMANDLAGVVACYSIGVGPQVIWDVDMAARGLDVYQYDHTVECAPAEHPRCHFRKLGIGPDLSTPDLVTLEKMLEDNSHSDASGLILKMDVEGAEWDVLDGMSSNTLSRFDQIVIEYHALEFLDRDSFRSRAERAFRTVGHTHRPIHIHGNNYAGFRIVRNIPIPDVIEVTYARKGRFEFVESDDVFPTHLDEPCDWQAPDLFLGSFKY